MASLSYRPLVFALFLITLSYYNGDIVGSFQSSPWGLLIDDSDRMLSRGGGKGRVSSWLSFFSKPVMWGLEMNV